MKLDLFEINELLEHDVYARIVDVNTKIKGCTDALTLREYVKELKALTWALSKYSK